MGLVYLFAALISSQPDVITRFEDVPIPPCIDTFIERVENEHFENNGQAAQAYKEFEIQALHSYITCLLASTCHILQVIVKQDELGPPPAVDPQHFETVCEAENKDPHAEIEEHYDNTIRRYREGLEPFKALCDFSGAQTATIKRERALISPDFLRNWLSLDDDRKSDRLKTRLKFIRRFSEREVHATFSYVTRAMVEEIGAIMLFKEQDACLKASDRLIKWILRFGGWLYEEDSSPSYWYGGAAEWVWG